MGIRTPSCPLRICRHYKGLVVCHVNQIRTKLRFRSVPRVLLTRLEWGVVDETNYRTLTSQAHRAISPPRLFSLALPREEPLRAALVGSLAREKLTGATPPSLLTACTRTVETMPAQRTNLGRSEDDHTWFNERGQDDDLVGGGSVGGLYNQSLFTEIFSFFLRGESWFSYQMVLVLVLVLVLLGLASPNPDIRRSVVVQNSEPGLGTVLAGCLPPHT